MKNTVSVFNIVTIVILSPAGAVNAFRADDLAGRFADKGIVEYVDDRGGVVTDFLPGFCFHKEGAR